MKSIPISNFAQKTDLSGDLNEDENDSFLIAEQKAQDEVEKNPFKDPLHELKTLRSKGTIYSLNISDVSSVDRKRSINFRTHLKPSVTYQAKLSGFERAKANQLTSRKVKNEFVDFDEEPMPLPQKIPSFIDSNAPKSENKPNFKKVRHTVDEKHIK